MRGSGSLGQILAAVVGGLMVLGGIASVGLDRSAGATGVWLVVVGLVLIVAAILERRRYRSEAAELAGLPIGPGGGEPTDQTLDARFTPTDERFVDPTSGRTMRVWLDRTTGERRYLAED